MHFSDHCTAQATDMELAGSNGDVSYVERLLPRKRKISTLQRVEAYRLLQRSEKLKISLHHVSRSILWDIVVDSSYWHNYIDVGCSR